MAAPMKILLGVAGSFFLIVLCVGAENEDEFNEELFLKPLPTGHLYAHFQFTTSWNISLDDDQATHFAHFHLFPKSLGEVLEKYHVRELHLSLTAGLWRYEKWAYPIIDASPGAELWVWFKKGTRDVDQVWTDLINVLSGMFCASLNFMDSKATVVPQYSFRPQGATSDVYNRFGTNLVRYAALPRENVCTENLTPWKKLLPCSSKAGLASLLNAGKVYDTNYNSLGLHFRPVCQNADCSQSSVELSQSLALVFEPVVVNRGKNDWNLRELFGRNLASGCPLAKRSKIFIDITSNKTLVHYFTLSPQPHESITLNRGGQKSRYAVYDIPEYTHSQHVLNLGVKYNRNMDYSKITPPVIHTHRYQTGYGQEKGGVACLIYNNHPTQEIPVIVMETLPWYLRTYLHTLRIERYSSAMKANENSTKITPVRQHFVQGRDRQSPYFLELVLRIPANSVTKISFEFERALLTWTEYPPDANHGFYVNSAVISTVLPDNVDFPSRPQDSSLIQGILRNSTETPFVRLHTETLLISLPTPDFSMPYNVICLACTVVAIAFGSIHNLTTRRFVVFDHTKKKGLLSKLKGLFSRRKKEDKKEDKGTEGEGDKIKGKTRKDD